MGIVGDAQDLAQDPAMRVIVGWRRWDWNAARNRQAGRLETQTLTREKDLKETPAQRGEYSEFSLIGEMPTP